MYGLIENARTFKLVMPVDFITVSLLVYIHSQQTVKNSCDQWIGRYMVINLWIIRNGSTHYVPMLRYKLCIESSDITSEELEHFV